MQLVQPEQKYRSSYLTYIEELGDEERYPFPLDFDHSDFNAMLNRIDDFRLGRNLPDGYVPSTTYWLVEDDEILGVSNLRHSLNDDLYEAGGHIGLGVRPSSRRLGVGVKLLTLTLNEAKSIGINDVHIHCYAENQASTALIELCGGKLHSSIVQGVNTVNRYIISRPT